MSYLNYLFSQIVTLFRVSTWILAYISGLGFQWQFISRDLAALFSGLSHWSPTGPCWCLLRGQTYFPLWVYLIEGEVW